jgi:hypothetical protein
MSGGYLLLLDQRQERPGLKWYTALLGLISGNEDVMGEELHESLWEYEKNEDTMFGETDSIMSYEQYEQIAARDEIDRLEKLRSGRHTRCTGRRRFN